MRTIYFDFNATTPLDPAVRDAMMPYLNDAFGNPSSIHHVGRKARADLDDARDRLARRFHCKPSELIFTSGGTESNNLAIFGAARLRRDRGRHVITSTVEHDAVRLAFRQLEQREGFDVTRIPVAREGRVDPDRVRAAIRADTVLVSVMAANNEIGSLQPVSEIGALCRERGVLFHTDAVQWFGKEPVEAMSRFEADLVSLCAHKFHGPKGAGLLFARSPLLPEPILFGGGHENERRAGTENLPGIIGLAEAAERFLDPPVFQQADLEGLTRRIETALRSLPGVAPRSPETGRLCNTVAATVEGTDSMSLVAGLDLEGICASSGSACSAGSLEPSHVIAALGIPESESMGFVRFSLGRTSTLEEVEFLERILPDLLERIRD